MAESVFIGPFRSEMQDFIFLKRSVGYKYNSEPGILSRFDRYLAVNYPQADALSKEAVTGWCSKTMHETAANHCSRASVIPIGSDGVPADILLYGKIVRQERGKVHGEISRFHRKSPPFPE